MISKRFIKSSLIYTLAGALPMASAIILLPFYVLYLPTEAYGALSVCLAFSALVQILATYSFDTSLYIHYHELKADPARLASFISSSFVFMIGLALAAGTVLSVSGHLLFGLFPNSGKISFYPYGLVAVGVGITQAIFKVHGNLLQIREKPETFLWSNVVCFAIIAITSIVGLRVFPNTLIGPLGGRLLAGGIMAVWALVRVFRQYGVHIRSPWRMTSASFNAYTFIYQLMQWGINSLDRFLILLFMPLTALSSVGIYDIAVKCLVPVELLLNGLNASVNPQVIKLLNSHGAKGSSVEINRYYYGVVSVILLAICATILVVPPGIQLFVHKTGYAEAVKYIPYVAVLYVFKAIRIYFVLPFSVLKKMRRITVLSFVVNLVKIGFMALLIPGWQLYGVIAASLLAFAAEVALLWYYLRQDYRVAFNGFKLMVGPFLVVLMVLVAEPLIGVHLPLLTHMLYGAIAVGLLWFAYRNELRTLDPLKILR
jgi:O-antigen/teichoic acid export membrane protein